MAKKDIEPIGLPMRYQRQVPQELFLRVREHGIGVLHHGFRHLAEGRRAARIFSKPDGVVVIPTDATGGMSPDEFDSPGGIRPIIYQVTENPQFIEFFMESSESFQVAVDVRDDDDFHSRLTAGAGHSTIEVALEFALNRPTGEDDSYGTRWRICNLTTRTRG